MNLLIDVGNTNIKITYKENTYRYKTKNEYSADSLYSMFSDELKNANFDSIIASSVVAGIKNTLNNLFEKYYSKQVVWLQHPMKTTIKIAIDSPKDVGSDLICLSAFVANKTNEGIIVNLGTATTITYIKDKEMKGVIISPGIGTQLKSIVKDTSLISNIDIKYVNKPIGKNNMDSLSIGIVNAHVEMIKGLVNNISPNAKLFLSGGNAHLIRDHISATYIEEATTLGLEVIANANGF